MLPSVPRWIGAWVIIGVAIVAALAVPTARLPSDESGLRRFPIEIDASVTVSQTFIITTDAFHAIELHAASTGEPVSGELRFEIYDVTDGGRLLRRADVPATDVIKEQAYRFEFPPIPGESSDQIYRLDVLASPSRPAQRVALWATKGEGYVGGSLFINGRERWADLTFATFAPAGRSIWGRLADASVGRPGLAQLLIGALAAYWVALGIVLRAWLRSSSQAGPA
jgi:hypothetical protein